METDSANKLHPESEGSIPKHVCINCGNEIEEEWCTGGWSHVAKHTQGCIVNGKFSGTRADPGYDPPSRVTKKEGCDCFYVYVGSMRCSLDWNDKCEIHGLNTDYYINIMMPKIKADNDKLLKLYKLRDEKRQNDSSKNK